MTFANTSSPPLQLRLLVAASIIMVCAHGVSHDACKRNYRSEGLLFYNRIPKCGSSTMIDLLKQIKSVQQNLLGPKSYRTYIAPVSHYKVKDPFNYEHEMYGIPWKMLQRCAMVAEESKRRVVYVNHVFFVDLEAHGFERPDYVQIVREPLSRIISGYYYMMYGPRKEELMIDRRSRLMEITGLDHPPTLDEYFNYSTSAQQRKCSNQESNNMMARYFCGFHSDCDDICTSSALSRAKKNLLGYSVVGINEEMDRSIELLQWKLPSFFPNAVGIYRGLPRSRQTPKHPGIVQPNDETIAVIKIQNGPDFELYDFAVKMFEAQYDAARACGMDIRPRKHRHH